MLDFSPETLPVTLIRGQGTEVGRVGWAGATVTVSPVQVEPPAFVPGKAVVDVECPYMTKTSTSCL